MQRLLPKNLQGDRLKLLIVGYRKYLLLIHRGKDRVDGRMCKYVDVQMIGLD